MTSDTPQTGEGLVDQFVVRPNSIDRTIREFLRDNFIVDADLMQLPGSASLTDYAILDSMGVLELVMFLEEHYRIDISNEETVPENLDTIDNAVRFIHAKLDLLKRQGVEPI